MSVSIPRGGFIVRHGLADPISKPASGKKGLIKRDMFHPGFLRLAGARRHLQLSIREFREQMSFSLARGNVIETMLQSLDPALIGIFEEKFMSLQDFLSSVPSDKGLIEVNLITKQYLRACEGIAERHLHGAVDVEINWIDVVGSQPEIRELKLAANLVSTTNLGMGYASGDKAGERVFNGWFFPTYLHPQTHELQKAGEEWLVGEQGQWDLILSRAQ